MLRSKGGGSNPLKICVGGRVPRPVPQDLLPCIEGVMFLKLNSINISIRSWEVLGYFEVVLRV